MLIQLCCKAEQIRALPHRQEALNTFAGSPQFSRTFIRTSQVVLILLICRISSIRAFQQRNRLGISPRIQIKHPELMIRAEACRSIVNSFSQFPFGRHLVTDSRHRVAHGAVGSL